MLNASDDILNQINCTDSSGEDGGNPSTNQKFAHAPPGTPRLPQYTLTPPKVNSPIPRLIHITLIHIPPLKFPQHNYPSPPLEEFPPTSDVFREFLGTPLSTGMGYSRN